MGKFFLVLAGIPVVFVVVILILDYNAKGIKSYWDKEVARLCLEEGGVTVYEKIEMSLEDFNKVAFTKRSAILAGIDFYLDTESVSLRPYNPYVQKITFFLKHSFDDRVLADWSAYSRRGGDFPSGLGAASSFSCLDVEGYASNRLESMTFIVREI